MDQKPFNPDLGGHFAMSSEADWRARVEAVLKGADFAKRLVSRTADGIAIQPLYPAALGATPQPTRKGPWRIAQFVDHPDPASANIQALADLEGGAGGLVLAFAGGGAARGFGIDPIDLADLSRTLADVRLDLIDLRLDPAPTARVNAAMLAALVEKQRLDPARLSVNFGLDPLGIMARHGRLPCDWPEMSRRLGEAARELAKRGFAGHFALADGRPFHEAGASEAQELAALLATGLAYLRAFEAGGLALDAASRGIAFLAVADTDEFLTVAKFRALRRLWARVEEACDLTPSTMRVDAETSWRAMTRHDPHANVLRGTLAAFSAGIGGADNVAILPHSAVHGLPDAFARRVARNAQSVLIDEANLARVDDPAAGAGGFEALTEALCDKAWSLFQEIEQQGGLFASLVAGRFQARVAETARARARDIATRRAPLTGTSEYAFLDERTPELAMPRAMSTVHLARMPAIGPIIPFGDAMRKLLTGASKAEAGRAPLTPVTCAPLASKRLAEPYEILRERAAALAVRGKAPRVTLVAFGKMADYATRTGFAANLFAAGGMATEIVEWDARRKDAVLQRLAGMRLICLCGTDEAYGSEAVETARSLRTAGSGNIWLAGRPPAERSKHREVGIAEYIFTGCDVLSNLDQALAIFEAGP